MCVVYAQSFCDRPSCAQIEQNGNGNWKKKQIDGENNDNIVNRQIWMQSQNETI